MMTKAPTTPTERIADCDAQLAASLPRWRRLVNVQPLTLGTIAPRGYDPSRLIEKYRLGVEIDTTNVERETARRELAAEQLADLGDGAEFTVAFAAADLAYQEAQRLADEAKAVLLTATRKRDRHRERAKGATAMRETATAALARWSHELALDQSRLTDAERIGRLMPQLRANGTG
jgi:hypothetical protein